MLEISRKWGMLALALATGVVLAAAPTGLHPMRAYATDGIEVVDDADPDQPSEKAKQQRDMEDAYNRSMGHIENVTYKSVDNGTEQTVECSYISVREVAQGQSHKLTKPAYTVTDSTPVIEDGLEVEGDVSVYFTGSPLQVAGAPIHVKKGSTLRIYVGTGWDGEECITGREGADTESLIVNDGTVEVWGGRLGGNADYAVRNHKGATIRLYGGTVEGCSRIGVYNEGGSVHVKGAPVLVWEKGGLLLMGDLPIEVDGRLDDGASIDVLAANGVIFTHGYAKHNGNANPAAFFTPTDSDQQVYRTDEGEVLVDAKGMDSRVSYMDENGRVVNRARAQFECDLGTFTCPNATLNSAWYYVSKSNTISERVEVAGDAKIVLCNGATLTCTKGIHVPAGKTLEIYSRPDKTGKLLAYTGICDAGIGGNEDEGCGTVKICGADVEVSDDPNNYRPPFGAAGIGGGSCGAGGNVTICYSNVIAKGGYNSAGIGGGEGGSITNGGAGGTVVIRDSHVLALGDLDGAGIGGGACGGVFTSAGNGGDVTITGNSVVEAQSKFDESASGVGGAAIGRGRDASGVGKVRLSDNLRVVDLDNNGVIAPFNLRGEYCKYRNHVRVEPGESCK